MIESSACHPRLSFFHFSSGTYGLPFLFLLNCITYQYNRATMYHTLYLAGRAYATDFHETSNIPPILSCGSTSSMGSGTTHYTMGGGTGTTGSSVGGSGFDKKKYSSTSASAKELPTWLVATFLLMHCEDTALSRNLSSLDDRRISLSDPLMNILKYPIVSSR